MLRMGLELATGLAAAQEPQRGACGGHGSGAHAPACSLLGTGFVARRAARGLALPATRLARSLCTLLQVSPRQGTLVALAACHPLLPAITAAHASLTIACLHCS